MIELCRLPGVGIGPKRFVKDDEGFEHTSTAVRASGFDIRPFLLRRRRQARGLSESLLTLRVKGSSKQHPARRPSSQKEVQII
jgi:hypothetical protein